MTETAFRSSRLFKVLGNPLRYKILCELLRAPQTPTELARLTHRRLPAVSLALGLLQGAGLVWYQTHGHGVVYRARFPEVAPLITQSESLVRRHGLLIAAAPPAVDRAVETARPCPPRR